MVKNHSCSKSINFAIGVKALALPLAFTLLTTSPAHADFVLVLLPDGKFVSQTEQASQSRLAFQGKLAEVAVAKLPSPRIPSADVSAAISEVGMRYASSLSLRIANLSVSDWLALFQANIEIESAYNTEALSHVGAIGLGQLMPDTAKELRVDPHKPRENLDGSARYLLGLLEQFGSVELALAAYNAGPGAVEKHAGIPPYKETQGHVRKVMAVWNRIKQEGA